VEEVEEAEEGRRRTTTRRRLDILAITSPLAQLAGALFCVACARAVMPNSSDQAE
jgi:hypothetical protein